MIFAWLAWNGIRKKLDRYGWTVIAVDEGAGGPAFAYTVGLSAKFGSPELCVAGLPSRAAGELLGKLVEDVSAGRLSLDGDNVPAGLGETQDCVWRRVHPSQFVGDNFGALLRWREEEGAASSPEAYQWVWPDDEGRLPFDSACRLEVRMMQTPLWAPYDPEWWAPLAKEAGV